MSNPKWAPGGVSMHFNEDWVGVAMIDDSGRAFLAETSGAKGWTLTRLPDPPPLEAEVSTLDKPIPPAAVDIEGVRTWVDEISRRIQQPMLGSNGVGLGDVLDLCDRLEALEGETPTARQPMTEWPGPGEEPAGLWVLERSGIVGVLRGRFVLVPDSNRALWACSGYSLRSGDFEDADRFIPVED